MIVVGTTLTTFAMRQPETWQRWLRGIGGDPQVKPFAAIEFSLSFASDTHAESTFGDFWPLLAKLDDAGGEWWSYSMVDGRREVATVNRGRHIAMGRNMIFEYALKAGATHVLMMDADIEMPPYTIERLLELNAPVAGAFCRTFNQSGPRVGRYPADWNVQHHLATGCTLYSQEVFNRLRWSCYDDWGMKEMCEMYGYEHIVRHDTEVYHYPQHIPPLEQRGYDLSL